MWVERPFPFQEESRMARTWKNAQAAAAYINKGKRFVLREVKAHRLRAARIGGRGEILTCDEWLDEWVTSQAEAVPVTRGRR
jgi:hypothetical protein